jgi:hypothetical protein
MDFARPKSRIFARPSGVSMMLSGFKSRCAIPAACAAASPSAICTAMSRTFFSGIGPRWITPRNVSPGTSSETINPGCSWSATSKIATMFG